MYYALFLPEKGWTRQSVEVRKDALLACGARRFALHVSAGAEAGGLTRRVDLVGQHPYICIGAFPTRSEWMYRSSGSGRADCPALNRRLRRSMPQAHHVFSRVTAPENCGTVGA